MKFISNVKNINHEVNMLFMCSSKNERKVIDVNIFEALIIIAVLQFSSLKKIPEVKYL